VARGWWLAACGPWIVPSWALRRYPSEFLQCFSAVVPLLLPSEKGAFVTGGDAPGTASMDATVHWSNGQKAILATSGPLRQLPGPRNARATAKAPLVTRRRGGIFRLELISWAGAVGSSSAGGFRAVESRQGEVNNGRAVAAAMKTT